jgi:hypothetical protein
MYCFLTARKLKPGSYDDFIRAWGPDSTEDWPEGFTRAYTVRSLDDENEVVSFGFFEGGPEDLARMRTDASAREPYERMVEEVDKYVESVGTDGVFEVTEERTPPS